MSSDIPDVRNLAGCRDVSHRPPVMPLEPSSFAQSAHTLPRNFTFHYHDGDLPKTPEPSDKPYLQRTSPPPVPVARVHREPYRLRRRRAPVQAAQRAIRAFHQEAITHEMPDPLLDNQDVPVPSIELTDSAGLPANLQPPQTGLNFFAPPKTPVAQIYESAENGREASSSQEDLTRPSTACSGFSNSSKSSSVESFPSFCGASPKLEPDPFGSAGFAFMSPPLQDFGFVPTGTARYTSKHIWTKDMDDHLWLTYMRYLQDPTHTPFKMLPGTAPPPGVCSRVIREAKKTWRGSQTSAVPAVHRFARWGSSRAESLDVSGNTVSNGNTDRRSFAPWPRSDSASRKRLRDLCKLKPTLSAHYGRLLHARSPTPFLSSNRSSSIARELASPQSNTMANTFSTRDMNISLVTSTSTTMQPGHPINQLTSEAPIEARPAPFEALGGAVTPRPRAVTHYEPTSVLRTPSHHKSQSVQEGSSMNNFRPLASPFRPTQSFNTASRKRSHDFLQTAVAAESVPNPLAGPALAAPVELHAPVPRRSLFKRPAQNELEDMMNSEDPYTRQTHLMRELFGTQPLEVSHRRVRSRGFSLGDMSASSRLESLFGASSQEQPVPEPTQPSLVRSNTLLPPPSIEKVARLGSPFAEKPATKTHFNTFPRNFSLIGLEPAMDISEDHAERAEGEQPMSNVERS